jgi:hypothetical protein
MKKYTLLNDDGTESFGTNFIPTACAFTSLDLGVNGDRQLRFPTPDQRKVISGLDITGNHVFSNGQKLVKN